MLTFKDPVFYGQNFVEWAKHYNNYIKQGYKSSMSVKDLKTAFAAPVMPPDSDVDGDNGPEEYDASDDGIYPRSLHILDFSLTNLFETAYAIPHLDRYRLTDGLDMMAPEEMDAYEDTFAAELGGRKIDRLPAINDPVTSYSFLFDGFEDWNDFSVTLTMTDAEDGEDIDLADAHPGMQAAFAEFMEDLSLTTSVVDGIKIDTKRGIIRARDPLALFMAISEVIHAHNEAVEDKEAELKMREDDPAFPLEFRSIPLPQHAFEPFDKCNDADMDRNNKIGNGHDYLFGEDTQNVSLQNLPPRAYNSIDDACQAADQIRDRFQFSAPMVRLDEMEAIIRNEMRREKSYAPNPILNLH